MRPNRSRVVATSRRVSSACRMSATTGRTSTTAPESPRAASTAILANLSRILVWWREVDWRAVAAYSATGAPFAALGAATLLVLPARLIEAGTSSKGAHQDRCLRLEVADTGVGIPSESLALIFEKFCQLDTTSTRLHGGVGIGLYLVHRFTTVLGGEVTVKSQVGKGSTFVVMIPFIAAGLTKDQDTDKGNADPI